MNARSFWTVSLALGFVACFGGSAGAQRANIGFEGDCNGAATPGTFDGITGQKSLAANFYATCGVQSITGTNTSGIVLQQSAGLHPIDSVTGMVAAAGPTLSLGGRATLTLVFSPPVNELSFDMLDLDNGSGLTISLATSGGVSLPAETPTASGKTVHYVHTPSATPIQQAVITYTAPTLSIAEGWFLDQLAINAWVCGDGVVQAGEACDDGNRVQCDGCNNSCQLSGPGCFNGTSCVPSGSIVGCSSCVLAVPPAAGSDTALTPLPVGTGCNDGLFCTVGDMCDGLGVCKATPNPCLDAIDCTLDACDEPSKSCLHPIAPKFCLIAGVCVASGASNPLNKCELCTPTTLTSAWAKQPVGLQCSDPSCSAGMQTAAATCDAGGTCQPGLTQACMFGTCATLQSCDALCTGDVSCAQQAHCLPSTMMCVADLTPGSPCTRSTECSSNFCVDGVCCNESCSGACESCAQPASPGTCSPLPVLSVDPENRCQVGQFCSASGQCVTPPPVVVPPPQTDPTQPGMPVVPPDIRPMGTVCDRNEVCGSGLCVDGVCCDRACDGLCEACNAEGVTPGVCSPIALGEDPNSECLGVGLVCSGHGSCTEYETRGNGLCASSPRDMSRSRERTAPGYLALLALALGLVVRRRAARKRT